LEFSEKPEASKFRHNYGKHAQNGSPAAPKLELSVKHGYLKPGKYTVVVKVIDILGNDTTKTLTVEIK
jgi:PKD domain-containing protein